MNANTTEELRQSNHLHPFNEEESIQNHFFACIHSDHEQTKPIIRYNRRRDHLTKAHNIVNPTKDDYQTNFTFVGIKPSGQGTKENVLHEMKNTINAIQQQIAAIQHRISVLEDKLFHRCNEERIYASHVRKRKRNANAPQSPRYNLRRK